MIKEDYVSFETAKLLKEKGFVVDNVSMLIGDDNNTFMSGNTCYEYLLKYGYEVYPAPTLQMAMKWLREEKNIIINIWWSNGDDTAWCSQYLGPVPSNPKLKDFFLIGEGYRTYEEACEESIKYCLKNLLKDDLKLTKEEAYNYLRENASDTQNGLMVHISRVEKAIELVAVNDELKEKALDMCVGDCLDWVQIGNAEYYVDIALGIEED